MAEEKVFLDERGVSVTSARMMFGSEMHTMNGVTSVKSYKKTPSRILPSLIALFGLFLLYSKEFLGGLIFIGIGAAIWYLMKPKYSVALFSASGEATAYVSKDQDFVSKIISAINDAIVHRG